MGQNGSSRPSGTRLQFDSRWMWQSALYQLPWGWNSRRVDIASWQWAIEGSAGEINMRDANFGFITNHLRDQKSPDELFFPYSINQLGFWFVEDIEILPRDGNTLEVFSLSEPGSCIGAKFSCGQISSSHFFGAKSFCLGTTGTTHPKKRNYAFIHRSQLKRNKSLSETVPPSIYVWCRPVTSVSRAYCRVRWMNFTLPTIHVCLSLSWR